MGIARYARCESLLDRLRTQLGDDWDQLPESIRTRWVRALVDLRVARLLAYRAVSLQDDAAAGAAASAARIATTTCDQQVAELLFDVLGPTALDSGTSAPLHGAIEDHWRYAQAATVASGTIEVQKMLVARDVLGETPVKTDLPQDISDFAAVAAQRLARLGGPPAALRAETDDGIREAARAALGELGAFELDVRSSADDVLAAAVLCQAAGATALPYPLVEELLAIDGARLALVNPEAPRIDHGDLAGDWIAADLDGNRYQLQPMSRTSAKLGPFLVPATLSAPDGNRPGRRR